MQKTLNNAVFIVIATAFLLLNFSCEQTKNDSDGNPTFVIGSTGKGDLDRGLYKYTVGGTPEFLTDNSPFNYSSWYFSENNGVVAFTLAQGTRGNTSGIAYMFAEDLSQIYFAPIPSAEEGYYYSVSYQPPKVLSDGRIAYLVALETDSEYDSWFAGMIAIYDHESGELELSGDPTEFVLSQPEIMEDTEDGTMNQIFAVSPDNKNVYCQVYGYGTDFGEVHRDYSFIVKYTIGSSGSYERITQIEADPVGVTGDGRYLLLTSGAIGLKKVELATGIISQVTDYYIYPGTGHISSIASKLIQTWGSSINTSAGFGELDVSTNEPGWIHIIDEDLLPAETNYYPDLDLGTQYSHDESGFYFGVNQSSVEETHIDICFTPKVELNENPKTLGSISKDFDMNVFVLVSK